MVNVDSFMEMYILDRLNIRVERFYRHIPEIILDIYSAIWALSQSDMLRWAFGRFLLLVVDLVRDTILFLAYIFHFDPPTFNALRHYICAYMDPVADAEHKQLSLQLSSLQLIVAQLRDDKMRLVRLNQHLRHQVGSMGDKALHTQKALTAERHTTRQLLLGILACRHKTLASTPLKEVSQVPLIVVTKLQPAGIPQESVDQERLQAAEHLCSRLLVELLGHRRSMKAANAALATMTSELKSLQHALDHQRTISPSLLLVELLTIRKQARMIYSENQVKARLAFMLVQTHYQKRKVMELQHERFTRDILVQLLLFRKQLSLSRPLARGLGGSAGSPVIVPISDPGGELESLRLSEAQVRAEKDSLANSLENILRELDFLKPFKSAPETPPVTELVLALAFAWKSLRRPKPDVSQRTVPGVKHSSNAGHQLLPVGVAADSVRARAFRLGLPVNMSATMRPTTRPTSAIAKNNTEPYPTADANVFQIRSQNQLNSTNDSSHSKPISHCTNPALVPPPEIPPGVMIGPSPTHPHQPTSQSQNINDTFPIPSHDFLKHNPAAYPGVRLPPIGAPPLYRDNAWPPPVGAHAMFPGPASATFNLGLDRDTIRPSPVGAPSHYSTIVSPMSYSHPHLPREFWKHD
ncbi:hypothetical protein BU17DRAFT_95282 [Hysterangium stoloniferum]|nr:hypothetical protein BU17DRAFT_95282 [Hysterangium stoloniferum]